jgi:hypothetical protein
MKQEMVEVAVLNEKKSFSSLKIAFILPMVLSLNLGALPPVAPVPERLPWRWLGW